MKTKFNGILTLLLAFVVQLTFAQEKTISGTVVDETNMPLPGATVVIKGTTTGTSTDFDGKYSITTNTGDVLTFSYVGYSEQDATVGSETTIDIALALDNSLEVVVVTAFGIKRKPDEITTSTQLVKGDAIQTANNPDAVQALTGKVSGLTINTTSSGVNPTTEIILRGNKSITGNNDALIVIDNVIYTSSGALSELDPSLIDSVNILKGAAGAALYGSRGINGAVIVTTKRGNKDGGKVTVDVKSSATFEEISFLPEMQDRYGKGYWGEVDAIDQGSWGPEYDGSIQPVGLPYPTINDFRNEVYSFKKDNMKPFFQTGTTFQNSVVITSGDSEGYMTLGYNKVDTEGIVPNDKLIRNSLNLSAGKSLGKWTLTGIARYSGEDENVVSNFEKTGDRTDDIGLYGQLAQLPSDVDVTQFSSGSNDDHWTAFGDSPYWILKNSRRKTRRNTSEFTAEVKYDFNENINAVYRASVRNRSSRFVDYVNDFTAKYTVTGDNRDFNSNLEIETSNLRKFTNDFLVSFDYDLTDDISMKSLIGVNSIETRFYNHNSFGRDLTIPNFYDLSNVSSGLELQETKLLRRELGIFANIDLGYKDYLFLNLTGRQEYNSKLNGANRELKDIGFFYPSAGVSFIPTKAFTNISGKILHKAKLSASYVQVGNVNGLGTHRIGDTGTQAAGFPYTTSGSNSFVLPADTTDGQIEPEFITTLEGNLNLELLRFGGLSRLTLDLAASFTTSENQILDTSVSNASGVSFGTLNVGETESKAYEADLGFTPIKTDNFKWSGNVGYSTYTTTVKKVTEQSNSVLTQGTGVPGTYAIVGQEFPLIQGSYYERDEEGRVVLDPNGNPIKGSGIKVLGKTTPDYILNFGTEIKYKGLKLSATADYRTGHSFYSPIYRDLTSQGRTFVTAENGRGHFLFPNSTIQGSGVANTSVLTGPGYGGPSAYAQYQDYVQSSFIDIDENFILDATAFKLREVALSYTLPSKLLERSLLNKVSVGFSGRNLLVVLPKENRGYNDPELAGALGGYGQTPPTKFYSMSVNLTF